MLAAPWSFRWTNWDYSLRSTGTPMGSTKVRRQTITHMYQMRTHQRSNFAAQSHARTVLKTIITYENTISTINSDILTRRTYRRVHSHHSDSGCTRRSWRGTRRWAGRPRQQRDSTAAPRHCHRQSLRIRVMGLACRGSPAAQHCLCLRGLGNRRSVRPIHKYIGRADIRI